MSRNCNRTICYYRHEISRNCTLRPHIHTLTQYPSLLTFLIQNSDPLSLCVYSWQPLLTVIMCPPLPPPALLLWNDPLNHPRIHTQMHPHKHAHTHLLLDGFVPPTTPKHKHLSYCCLLNPPRLYMFNRIFENQQLFIRTCRSCIYVCVCMSIFHNIQPVSVPHCTCFMLRECTGLPLGYLQR